MTVTSVQISSCIAKCLMNLSSMSNLKKKLESLRIIILSYIHNLLYFISRSPYLCTYFWQGFTGDVKLTSFHYFNQIEIKSVAIGHRHTLFLSEDGNVYVNGANDYGQLGLGSLNCKNAEDPIKLENLSGKSL